MYKFGFKLKTPFYKHQAYTIFYQPDIKLLKNTAEYNVSTENQIIFRNNKPYESKSDYLGTTLINL